MPADETGNGGGFVFDARSLPNPGREEQFQALTGKDAPVIDYLNQQESVHQFLAARAVARGRQRQPTIGSRGFKNLMVSFGCTGGQHRSVYPGRAAGQASARPPRRRRSIRHATSSWRSMVPDESHDSGRRPGHAPASAHRSTVPRRWSRSAAARCWRSRSRRLRAFGVTEVIVNAHHFAEMIVDTSKANATSA